MGPSRRVNARAGDWNAGPGKIYNFNKNLIKINIIARAGVWTAGPGNYPPRGAHFWPGPAIETPALATFANFDKNGPFRPFLSNIWQKWPKGPFLSKCCQGRSLNRRPWPNFARLRHFCAKGRLVAALCPAPPVGGAVIKFILKFLINYKIFNLYQGRRFNRRPWVYLPCRAHFGPGPAFQSPALAILTKMIINEL